MSALPPKADIGDPTRDVRFGPIADLASLESGPKSLPLNDSSPLHPALWYGRKRANIDLPVVGVQIASNVATLSVAESRGWVARRHLIFHQRVQE
jgi:hypothetical protein